MSKKNKNKQNTEYNVSVSGINSSRPVTDEDMDEIVIPYVRQRFDRGFRSMFIYIFALYLVLVVAVYFGDVGNFYNLLKYGALFFLGLFLFFVFFKFLNTLGARRLRKKSLFLKEVEFVSFSKDHRKTMSYKYGSLIVPSMVVKETTKRGGRLEKVYDCVLQDTNHFSAGCRINRRLIKGDKVYKITDKNENVIYLIGEGKKHHRNAYKTKSNPVLESILRAFLCCFGMGLIILIIQSVITLIHYIYECIIYKEILTIECVTWYTLFGEVSKGSLFLFFAFMLPTIVFILILMLLPILGTHIVDMFFGLGKKNK